MDVAFVSVARVFTGIALLAAASVSWGQAWPTRPLRMVVPYTAGGAADVVARQITIYLGESLGQPVVLENRAGANTIVGAEVVARSAPDGYTMLLAGSSTLALNTAGYKNLPYDAMKDFTHVAKAVSNYHLIAARKGFAPNTIPEVVALAKKKTDSVSYGSTGVGSPTHFAGLLLESMAGIKMLHVPYKGISQVVNDLLGESVDIAASAPTAVIPNIRAGKLKALASTSEKRLPAYPDVPSMWELGYTGFTTGAWYVIDVRAGTPATIVNRLNKDINAALQQPAIRKLLETEAFAIDGDLTPAETTKWVAGEIQKWGKIIRDAKLSFD